MYRTPARRSRVRLCPRTTHKILSILGNMGIEEVTTAPRSPWQNPYCERLVGSIRREVLDHVIILNDQHLRRLRTAYLAYDHRCRTHLSLAMDCPQPRAVQPPEIGKVRALPEVGGLHHH